MPPLYTVAFFILVVPASRHVFHTFFKQFQKYETVMTRYQYKFQYLFMAILMLLVAINKTLINKHTGMWIICVNLD